MEPTNMLVTLASLALRPLALLALAGAALLVLRARSAAVRHAVWTHVTAGMLLLASTVLIFPGGLPELRVRVLPARAIPPAVSLSSHVPVATVSSATHAPAIPAARRFPWDDLLVAIWLTGLLVGAARLASGLWLTRRLVLAARPLPDFPGETVLASNAIIVPMTVGCLRPSILLPGDWRSWPPEKLHAAMAHERAHIARGDWAIGLLAGINRSIYWFHPLAWWLERHLARLAEFACDDAAVAELGSPDTYAEVLVQMAAALRGRDGRVAWDAMAMARRSDVHERVERILDDSRMPAPGLSRARWLTLAVCALPLVYSVAVLRPARVQAQRQEPVLAVAAEAPPVEPQAAPLVAPKVLRAQAKPASGVAVPAQERLKVLREDELLQRRLELEQRLAAETEKQKANLEAAAKFRVRVQQLQTNLNYYQSIADSSQLGPGHPANKGAERAIHDIQQDFETLPDAEQELQRAERRIASEIEGIRQLITTTEFEMGVLGRERQLLSRPLEAVPAPGSYWQVLAVAPDVAAAVRQALANKGFPAHVTQGANALSRVLVGPYANATQRDRAKSELEAAGFKPALVHMP